MHMVRHDDKRIQHRMGEMSRDGLPTFRDDLAVRMPLHRVIHDSPEQMPPIMRADGDEIRPGCGIVVPLQTDGPAVVSVRVVPHQNALSMDRSASPTLSSPEMSLGSLGADIAAEGEGAAVLADVLLRGRLAEAGHVGVLASVPFGSAQGRLVAALVAVVSCNLFVTPEEVTMLRISSPREEKSRIFRLLPNQGMNWNE